MWERRNATYAGTIAEILQPAANRPSKGSLQSVQLVKAHQDVATATPNQWMARGNDLADKAANEARLGMQPTLSKDEASGHTLRANQALTTAKVIAEVLPLWPRITRYETRLPAAQVPSNASAATGAHVQTSAPRPLALLPMDLLGLMSGSRPPHLPMTAKEPMTSPRLLSEALAALCGTPPRPLLEAPTLLLTARRRGTMLTTLRQTTQAH